MKLRPVTKIGKATKTQLKTIDDEIMSENCDLVAIGQFGATGSRIPDA